MTLLILEGLLYHIFDRQDLSLEHNHEEHLLRLHDRLNDNTGHYKLSFVMNKLDSI